MRIVLIGERRLGEKALETLVKRGENIVGVYTAPDLPGITNHIRELALKLNIPVFPLIGVRSAEFYQEYVKLEPDLNVIPLLTTILPQSILNHPPLGTICLHPSLLPAYGGLTPICWPLINGETRTGVTVFWPDGGIDTGPILLQKEVEISPDDTQESLYRDKLLPLGLEAIVESIELVKKGTAPKLPQERSRASYYPPCTKEDAVINWVQPLTRIYNLIRGTYPIPGATTNLGSTRFKVLGVKPISGFVRGKPGEIIEITGDGIKVSVPDGVILIKELQTEGGEKIAAMEFSKRIGLKVRDGLGRTG